MIFFDGDREIIFTRPYVFPSPSLTCCVILSTSFGGNGTRFELMTDHTAIIDGLLAEVFRGLS
jgi:hypothetical protein